VNRKERRAKEQADKRSGTAQDAPNVTALLNQALQQHQTGNLTEAVKIYRQILSVSPDNADALNLLGLAHHQGGDHDRALELIGKAIQIAPSVALYHNNYAMALFGAGQDRAAIDSLRHAVALDPAYMDGWVNLADALDRTGQTGAAVTACQSENGDRAAAISALRQAIALEPRFADALERLGALLRDDDQPEAALEALHRALELEPNNEKAWFTTGLAKQDLDQLDDAISAFGKAIHLSPDLVEAHHNMGNVLRGVGRDDEAIAAFDKALALDPGRQDTRSDRSLTLLAAGRVEEGWQDYQTRRSTADIRDKLYLGRLPDDLTGKRILVLRDQGLGDEIFFLRFAPALKARGATILYRGQSQLTGIIGRLGFLDIVIDESRGDPPQDVDLWLSAGDLPVSLDMKSEYHIPPSIALSVLSSHALPVAEELRQFGPPPYLGVTWRAGIQKRNRLSKIAPLQGMATSLTGIKATFIALQREPEPDEIDNLSELIGRPVHDMTDLNNDLEAMLALLDRLDDYICVSNTNTHLRAALGKPSHVLVPCPADYRWMRSGDRSPWFPGSKLYRETFREGWEPAMSALAADLIADYSS
jgi:tetratricopeptide (TPR) repeat protein